MFTKELAEMIVHTANGRKNRIIKAIREQGFEVEDNTEPGSKFFNLRVWNEDKTFIRIYRSYRREVKVQEWKPIKYTYSGIPTFEPSGRRSF